MNNLKIAVVGLGYVGLPLAVALGKKMSVIGFDIDEKRIHELETGYDSSSEILTDELNKTDIRYTSNQNDLKQANFFIVAVPTQIDNNFQPDLQPLQKASEIIGRNLSVGSIVVYESTVYPGVTEDICGPILQEYSGLKCGVNFKLGYSPERINPRDKEYTVEKVIKIVSGQDIETLNIISDVYSQICQAGIHKASSIKVAEVAKLIENVQRDLNIALVNELSLIFNKLNDMGVSVFGANPYLGDKEIIQEYNIQPVNRFDSYTEKMDGVVICLHHLEYKDLSIERIRSFTKENPILVGIKGLFNNTYIDKTGILYFSS